MATILFFGRLQDALGRKALAASLPEDVRDTDALRDWLDHPALRDPSVAVAINAEVAAGNRPVGDGDEIAFLPPMSGG